MKTKPIPEKLCIFCQHGTFNFSRMYGEYPDPAAFRCWKNKLNGYGGADFSGEEEFRRIIMTAITCPDYKQVKA